jgi:hypothetical protein
MEEKCRLEREKDREKWKEELQVDSFPTLLNSPEILLIITTFNIFIFAAN